MIVSHRSFVCRLVPRVFLAGILLLTSSALRAQQAPTILGLSPSAATAGGPAFTLTVNGANYDSSTRIKWGTTVLATTLVSGTQLTAGVTAAQIGAAGSVNVAVMVSGGSPSVSLPFMILSPTGQTWTQLTPSGGPPSARAASSAIYDPVTAKMIVYAGSRQADVWSLTTSASPQWSSVTASGTGPPARSGHSAVYDAGNARMTVFGGGLGSSSPCANDVWTLSNANGAAGTPSWTQLSPTGAAPAPRIFHQAVYDPASNRMIVFGGNNCFTQGAVFYNDVWILTNANGLGGPPAWIQLSPSGTLPATRENFSAVYDSASNRMIIFGGGGSAFGGSSANDTWVLSNANGLNGPPAWTQLTPLGTLPSARSGHTATYDSVSNRMTIVGGYNPATTTDLSDVWLLANANGSGGTPSWSQLAPTGTLPRIRDVHTAVYDANANRMLVFSGSSSGTPLNDVWSLSDANGALISCNPLTGPGAIGATYAAACLSSGGTAPYTWSISAGSLPAGLTLNTSAGTITGTPTAVGPYSYTVSVTDSGTVPFTASQSFSGSILLGAPAVSYATGRTPAAIASADFNRDGIPDLVAVNYSENSFSYFAGHGDGTFGTGVTFAMTGANPGRIVTGDFNRDGNPDIAIVHPSSTQAGFGNTVSVHLGDGHGGFGTGIVFTTGGTDTGIAVGDFNGDGKPDLAIASCDNQAVMIHTGNGDGSFSLARQIVVNGCPGNMGLTAADLNNDGKLDIVVTSSGTNQVVVLIGDGTGNFAAPTRFPVAGAAARILVGDFNKDGKPDLAVQNYSGPVSLLFGDGTGNYGSRTDVAVGGGANDLAIGDFNLDGNLDLTSAATGVGAVTLLLGDGTGRFPSRMDVPAGASPVSITVADFNRDGNADIALTNSTSAQLSVLLSALPPVVSITTASPLPQGTVGVAYSQPLTASGGNAFYYSWTIATGTLPAGLALQGSLGSAAVTGTPTAAGSSTFTLTVKDGSSPAIVASKPFTLTIGKVSQTIAFAPLPDVTYPVAPFTVSATASSGLPVSFTAAPSTVCTLSGTTVTIVSGGICTVTAGQAGNTNYNAAPSVPRSFNVTVPPPSVTTTSLPSGSVGNSYFASLAATRGLAPYSGWTVASGSLPPGITLNASTGAISGTPTTAANSPYVFTATVRDSAGTTSAQSSALSITIRVPTPVVSEEAEVVTAPRSTALQPLLFPFTTNQVGFDTEITISNTAQDGLGSAPQNGTCSLSFYGSNASASQTSNSIPAGQQLIFNLSQGGGGITGAPGFQGYIIANCTFPLARGFAKGFGPGGRTFSMDAQALTLPRNSTAPQRLLFPSVTNQLGYDSSITIANTSQDPFGTTPTSGTCTLSLYGSGAPSPNQIVTPTIVAGTVFNTVVSNIAPGFQGYVLASCNFSAASGFGIITNSPGETSSAPAENVTLPRSATPRPLLFSSMSNQNGQDSVFAIANTSADPFGSTPAAGNCTLNFYGTGAPAAVVTPNIASGTVYTQLLSGVASGFQGYMTATCTFGQAKGFAYFSNISTIDGDSLPREAVVVPRATAPAPLLFSAVSNWNGNDTAITISNTSRDSFGTTAGAGTCTVSYFGQMNTGGSTPAPQVSSTIQAGAQLSFSLSQGNPAQGIAPTPGFRGYIIAACNFPLARGNAIITGTPPGLAPQTTITSASPLPAGTVGIPYSQTLSAVGGTSPYTWSLTSGALPGGVTLNTATGVISGTPTVANSFTFTVVAADSGTPQQTATKLFTVEVSPAAPTTGPGPAPPPPPVGGNSLTVVPTDLTLDVPSGGASASKTVILVYDSYVQGAFTFVTNPTTNQGFGWLSASPASGPMTLSSSGGGLYVYQATIKVTGSSAGISAGAQYTGIVGVNAGTGGVALVPVTMNVTRPITGPVTVSPSSLSFTYQKGDTNQPSSQSISIFSTPSGSAFSVSSTGSWLAVSPGSGTTPATVNVSASLGQSPGDYSGQITITPAGNPAVAIPITLTVKDLTPKLSVSPTLESFGLTQGSGPTGGQITVSNTGGGTLQFSAQASSDKGWLKLGANGPGTATAAAAASLGFTVDPTGLSPGIYTGQIAVTGTGSTTQSVTVTLAVTQGVSSLQLSQSGITFTSVANGPRPPSQSFTVNNQGSGASTWAAQTQAIVNPQAQASGNWLSISAPITTSVGGQPGGVVTVSANQNGLPPGQYYGSVNIVSDAVNSPQTVSVLLNVMAAPASSGAMLSTGGVTLSGAAGSRSPVSQTIGLFNPGNTTGTYATTTSTADGTGWLTVSPAAGMLNPGANQLTAQADLSKLPVGVQTGTVRVAFDDKTVGVIQVVVVVLDPSGGLSAGSVPGLSRSRLSPRASGCSPGSLAPNFKHPLDRATARVAVAELVQVLLVDNCNNPITAKNGGTIQITFSKDPAVDLHDVGNGIWEGTWTPANAASNVTVQAFATASRSGLTPIGGIKQIVVGVQARTASDAAQPTGAANAASAAQAIPQIVVPGSYVAIYGTGMASTGAVGATSVPLPTNLNNTQLLLGGKPLPLSYASDSQVNGLIPQNLSPNTIHQLVVQRGSTQSVPVTVTVAQLQPGLYTRDQSGSGQGAIQIAGTTLLAASSGDGSRPALRGSEYLVVYGTGFGEVKGTKGEPAPEDGGAATPPTVYLTAGTVTATVGGMPAPVVFAGLTPTLVALYQFNVLVPAGAPTGDAVPVVLTMQDASGNTVQSNTVTVAVQ